MDTQSDSLVSVVVHEIWSGAQPLARNTIPTLSKQSPGRASTVEFAPFTPLIESDPLLSVAVKVTVFAAWRGCAVLMRIPATTVSIAPKAIPFRFIFPASLLKGSRTCWVALPAMVCGSVPNVKPLNQHAHRPCRLLAATNHSVANGAASSPDAAPFGL